MRDVTGGYWGLMIILSAFMIQLIAFGTSLSIGIYNIKLLEINQDAFAVSLVCAINTGVFLGSGPLASLLMNHISHRKIVLMGAGLTSASMICMPYLPSLSYMYVVYGVGAGLGSCLVYVPSHVMSGLYYDKHRSMATGVATAGSGLGMTVFPIVVGYLIEKYTWRPSLLVVSGLTLNLFVFALLLRPLPKSKCDKDTILEESNLTDTPNNNESHRMLNGEAIANNSSEETEQMLDNQKQDGNKKTNQFLQNGDTSEKKPLKHFYVFCSFNFDVYFISNILWNMACNMMLMFAPDYLTTIGMTSIEAAFMLTITGLSTFLGSLLSGSIGNHRCVNRVALYVVCCLIGGFGIIGFPHVDSYMSIVAVHVFLGLGFGGILGLLVVLTTDILGPESLGDGVGYLMLANGVGCFAGPPIAGALKNSLGTYSVSFYTAAGLMLMSGVMMVLLPLWNSCHRTSKTITELEVKL